MVDPALLFGVWKLRSWTTEVVDTKQKFSFFGDTPQGYINFGPDGRVFAILTAEHRKEVTSEADQIAAFSRVVAYTGRYRIEGEKLVTTVDVSADPGMIGKELIRFFRCDGTELEIVTAPFVSDKPAHNLGGKKLRSFLLWHR